MTRDARPLIGVTADISEVPRGLKNHREATLFVPQRYLHAIERAGAIPLVLPANSSTSALRRLVSLMDGLVITGGNFDIPTVLRRNPAQGARRRQSAAHRV